MDEVNEHTQVNEGEAANDISSPLNTSSVSKPLATDSAPQFEDIPKPSSHASSVTLTVNDNDAEMNVGGGFQQNVLNGMPPAGADKARRPTGWPSRKPFYTRLLFGPNGMPLKERMEVVYWADLTWKQKIAWRKAFLSEYLSETRKCLPFVWKLYVIIYRLSPWRAVVLLVVSIFRGILPALTLQTRGNFIMMLQEGLEKKALDKRGLLRLFIQQVVGTALNKITEDIVAKMNLTLNARLLQTLDIGLIEGYLELDISELDSDSDFSIYFRDARRLVKEEGLSVFTKQINIIREATSVLSRFATLSSMTTGNSWPILSLTASLPILDYLLGMIPWNSEYDSDSHYMTASMEEHQLNTKLRMLEQIAKSSTARAELMIFNAKEWIVKHYKEICAKVTAGREAGRFEIRQEEPPFVHRHVLPVVHSAARALLYLTVAYQPDYFGMSVSQLSFLESSIAEVFTSLSFLRQSFSDKLVKDLFRIRNVCECMEVKSSIQPPENPAPYISHPSGMKIELRNVSFRYNETSPFVLKDISFTIERGQIVSVVGYNGSGKTTLIRLLAFLNKPTVGDIFINEVNASEYDPKILRLNMSILFQEFQKYTDFSTLENIAIGKPDIMGKLPEVRKAASQSGAHDFIRSFGSFYQTKLTREYSHRDYHDWLPASHFINSSDRKSLPFKLKILSENLYWKAEWDEKPMSWLKPPKKTIDIKIPEYEPEDNNNEEYFTNTAPSGGQWQRIALARSFTKIKDADLLILDEPSSALDPQAEYEVFKTIMELRKDKTTIYIVPPTSGPADMLVSPVSYGTGGDKDIGIWLRLCGILTAVVRRRQASGNGNS